MKGVILLFNEGTWLPSVRSLTVSGRSFIVRVIPEFAWQTKEIYWIWDNWLTYALRRPRMYMVRNVWKCARGKVPECLEVVKEVRASWASDGNTTGKIYTDYTDRMDTIAFEIEVESLDEYFNNQRSNYDELSPETEESVRQFNSNTVEGNRQIWEVIS